MKKTIFIFLIFCLHSGFLYADILEIKDRGILSGKILSDDGKFLSFENSSGQVEKVRSADVLMKEIENAQNADQTSSHEGSWMDTMKSKSRIFVHWLVKAPGKLKEKTDQVTKKFIGNVGKPLDRSVADKKSAHAAKILDDSNKSVTAMNKKVKAVNAEINRQSVNSDSSIFAAAKKKAKQGYTEL